jgi:mannose-6-phosphate isomerase-like protein (cupin superfamily)
MSKVVKIGSAAVPPLELVKGMNTRYNVCQETTGTETLRMGVCHHEPDMADMTWQGKAEEAFYVAKGSIKVAWDDGQGDKGEAVIREGEQIFMPKGYQYVLKSTGEPAINVFAIAGGPTAVSAIMGQEAGDKLREAARKLGRA